MKWFGNNSGKTLPASTLEGKTIDVGDHRLRVEEHLGDGGFAVIYRVKDVKTGQHYALKHVIMRSPEAKTALRDEAKTMKRVQGHPHVISLYCVAFAEEKDDEQDAFMLMDLCSDNLYSYLHRRNFVLPDAELLDIFTSVCRAVQHLHSQKQPICHRDIKIENVLKHLNGKWVLCDFGSATTKTRTSFNPQTAHSDQQEINKNTTPAYRAPEMWDVMMGQPIDERADIWALGCMLYLLCYGSLPFTGASQLEVMAGKTKFPHTRDMVFAKAIAAMLNIDPERRPRIHSLIKMVEEIQQTLASGGSSATETKPPPVPPPAHQLEPRSQSATLKSDQISMPPMSSHHGTLSAQPSLPNSSTLRETFSSGNGKGPLSAIQDGKQRGQSLDGSPMPPIQRPAATVHAARSPNQPPKQPLPEAIPPQSWPVSPGRAITDTDSKRSLTPSIPKLPISPALAGNTRATDNTLLIVEDIKSLKTTVGHLNEQNQSLWSKVATLENIVRSQQQLIQELQLQRQQPQVIHIPVAPSPKKEAVEEPLLPNNPSPSPTAELLMPIAPRISAVPDRDGTPVGNDDVALSPVQFPSPVHATPPLSARKEQTLPTPREKKPVAKIASKTPKTNSGRFAGTFWNSIAEKSPNQQQPQENNPAVIETVDTSTEAENRHKRVVSDPPPIDSWHTSGKL